jgi:hypothetical protein
LRLTAQEREQLKQMLMTASIVSRHADGSDDPADLVAFYRRLQSGYDCVFGSRFMRGARSRTIRR